MAKLGISTGVNPNDGLGDTLLTGAIKINSNFNEIYSTIGDGVNITNSIGYALTAGIATFAGISSQVSSTIDINTTGIITASKIVATGPSSFLDDLIIDGDLKVSGILTVGSASVTIDGDNNTINVGSGVTIEGNNGVIRSIEFYADGIQVGVLTAESIVYNGTVLENVWTSTTAGIHTLSNVGVGTSNSSSKLTVNGDVLVSGVTTTNSLSIGSTQVISSDRQLQNITSLDSITTETIETAIANAPNTFTDLNITGITTLSRTTISELNVSGVTTSSGGFVGNLQGNVTGTATTANNATNLDNQTPSYYLDYDNFTNTPTNLSEFSNDVGFATETYVNNLVAISTFSGNYNDLTNTPTNLSEFSNDVGFATETYVNNLVAISTFSGNYNDLTNTPTNLSEFSNDVGFATETYVDLAIANLVNSAPETLDTLNELAAALGDDPNFATTITNELGNKANLSGANFTGIVTSTSFVGNLTGTASFATVAGIATYTSEWILGAVGSSDYTFTGPGFTGAVSDPDLYLVRGQQYKFTNTMGAHPFRIQSTPNGSTGTQYNDGIVNNNVSNGTLTWNVQFNAPGLLYYQCTAHGGMGGKIYIVDAGVGPDISVNTTGIITASSFVGDGSGLTGIVATGTSVDIQDDGSPVGIASTINFGDNLTVNFSDGVATINSSGGISDVIITTSDNPPESPVDGNLWYDSSIGRGFIYYDDGDSLQWVDFSPALSGISTGGTGGGESYWTETLSGIHTLSNVGIGTTNPETALSIYYGVLSFAGKGSGDERSDISIGNSTTNSAYAGEISALNNIFIGNKVFETKTGSGAPAYNIVIGDRAGNTLGDGCQENVIIGRDAGYVNEGNANTFVGNRTGTVNKGGGGNSFYGYDAGIDNTEGDYNTFIGIGGGFAVTTGSENTLVGSYSGGSNKTGNANVAVGYVAGTGSTNSSYNIHAGSYNGGIGTGSYNVVLGSGNKGTFNNPYWFDLPSPNKSYQFAVGIRTDVNPSRYWLVGDENFNVGIGTTNPTSALQVERYSISTGIGTFNALVGAAHTFDSFNISESNYKTVEYTVHIENESNIQSQKVLIMQNGTNVYSQEYAIMFVPSQIVSIGATISSGVCEINLLPSSGISGLTTYTFSREGLL
jgi:plastocyanin